VTTACPASVVTIDRSFAKEPPVCINELPGMQITGKTPLGVVAIDAGGAKASEMSCRKQVREWVEAERAARMTLTELTQ
jgi:hypothetical protein